MASGKESSSGWSILDFMSSLYSVDTFRVGRVVPYPTRDSRIRHAKSQEWAQVNERHHQAVQSFGIDQTSQEMRNDHQMKSTEPSGQNHDSGSRNHVMHDSAMQRNVPTSLQAENHVQFLCEAPNKTDRGQALGQMQRNNSYDNGRGKWIGDRPAVKQEIYTGSSNKDTIRQILKPRPEICNFVKKEPGLAMVADKTMQTVKTEPTDAMVPSSSGRIRWPRLEETVSQTTKQYKHHQRSLGVSGARPSIDQQEILRNTVSSKEASQSDHCGPKCSNVDLNHNYVTGNDQQLKDCPSNQTITEGRADYRFPEVHQVTHVPYLVCNQGYCHPIMSSSMQHPDWTKEYPDSVTAKELPLDLSARSTVKY